MSVQQNLKIVFLLGADSESTRLAVESVCALPNVATVAALLDSEKVGLGRRIKNLRRNVRKEGWTYAPRRVLEALRSVSDGLVERAAVSSDEVRRVLATAFPERCASLSDLSRKYQFRVEEVGSLNGPEAVRVLKETGADLGIVLGTRILKEPIFSVPRLGCINLHKGKVPEYRGMPPGFWELYDGAATAGVTVHFVDQGLDTGDIIAASEVPIVRTDTPDSLRQKLHEEGARVLSGAVSAIQSGTAEHRKQGQTSLKPRTKPTLAQTRELQKRLPHWRVRSDASVLAKNLYCLFVYYSGLYFLGRLWHSRAHARGCILLHHRVNDYSKDVLTVDTQTFAAQLIAIGKRYPSISTSDLVQRIRGRERIAPTTIAIHFDDCYRDILVNGAPILKATGYPALAFVSSGFVDTDRAFAHDREKYPFRYPNLRTEDLRAWVTDGFEIGAHTVNHADLGQCDLEEARFETVESRVQLETMVSGNGSSSGHERKVAFFSFPFGRIQNIRSEVVALIREVGYSALFSAHGGFVGPKTDLYDVPRIGCCGDVRPLYLLLEIEGLTPGQLTAKFTKLFS